MNNDLEKAIRSIVESIGDPLMMHIQYGVREQHNTRWTNDEIRDEVMAMVHRNVLRMKEDCVDHDWSYRKGKAW